MGCATSRQHDAVEQVLSEEEAKADFCRLSCRQVDYVLRKYSAGLSLSPDRFECAMQELGLSTRNEWRGNYRSFMDSFRNGETYSLPLTLVALMLLASGSQRQKLEMLFEIMDPGCTNVISEANLSRLLSALLRAAVLTIPLLYKWDYILPRVEGQDYIRSLEAKLRTAETTLRRRLLKTSGEVTLPQFLAVASSASFPDLTTPRGLREFTHSMSPAIHERVNSAP